jgi:hypothetical protein
VNGSLVVANAINNNASIALAAGSALQAVNLTNNGFIDMQNGSTVVANVTTNRRFDSRGSVTIQGNLANTASLSLMGPSTDLLTITGDFNQAGGASLFMRADNNGCAWLKVGATASLAGDLIISTPGGANDPKRSNVFNPVTYNVLQGNFNQNTLRLGKYTFISSYGAGAQVLWVPPGGFNPEFMEWWTGVGIWGDSGKPWWLGTAPDGYAPGLTQDNYSVSIDWGNGTGSGTIAGDNPFYQVYAGNEYSSAGDYTVTVTVTDTYSGVSWDGPPMTFHVSDGGGFAPMMASQPAAPTTAARGATFDTSAASPAGASSVTSGAVAAVPAGAIQQPSLQPQFDDPSCTLALASLTQTKDGTGSLMALDSYFAGLPG